MSRRFLTYETDDAEAGKVDVDETGQLKPSEGGGATWVHIKNTGANETIYKGKEDVGDADILTYKEFISAFDNGLVIVDNLSESNIGCDLVVSYSINQVNSDGSVIVDLQGGSGSYWHPLMSGKDA